MAKPKKRVIKLRVKSGETREEIEARVKAWNEAPQRMLAKITAFAVRNLKPFAIEDSTMREPAPYFALDLGDGLKTYRMQAAAPRRAVIARWILEHLHSAMSGGQLEYRFYYLARAVEAYATLLVSQRGTNKLRQDTTNKASKSRAEYLKQKTTHRSFTDAVERAAEALGVSSRTVKRHLTTFGINAANPK